MSFAWQTAVVLVLVAAACAYLARVAWLTIARRQRSACGGCRACPAGSAENEPAVVTLGTSGDVRRNGTSQPRA